MVWMAGLRGVVAFICALGFPDEAGRSLRLTAWFLYKELGSAELLEAICECAAFRASR